MGSTLPAARELKDLPPTRGAGGIQTFGHGALGVGCAPGGVLPSLLIPPKKKKRDRERERETTRRRRRKDTGREREREIHHFSRGQRMPDRPTFYSGPPTDPDSHCTTKTLSEHCAPHSQDFHACLWLNIANRTFPKSKCTDPPITRVRASVLCVVCASVGVYARPHELAVVPSVPSPGICRSPSPPTPKKASSGWDVR